MRVLNRIVRITDDGIEYEADQRHADLVIKQLALEKSNSVLTPADEEIENKVTDDQGRCMNDNCDSNHAALYRSIAARLNYVSPDHPDLQYSIKEICRRMADPTWRDFARLKRLGRYMIGRPRLVSKFRFQGAVDRVIVMSDANWAGCKTTRKSTSGGCVLLGKHCVKSWSKTQHCISTSSAESEGVAIVKEGKEMGIARILEDFENGDVSIDIMADASAALGMIEREGVGRVRHIDVAILWLQQRWLQKAVYFSKIVGTHNTSDLMTKALCRQKADEFVRDLNGEYRSGRAGKSVKLQEDVSLIRIVRGE